MSSPSGPGGFWWKVSSDCYGSPGSDVSVLSGGLQDLLWFSELCVTVVLLYLSSLWLVELLET